MGRETCSVPMMDVVQERFVRLGWSMGERTVDTLGGKRLWLVFGKRNKQVFSAQGETRTEAWDSAWRLAQQLHLAKQPRPVTEEGQLIVPFQRLRDKRVA